MTYRIVPYAQKCYLNSTARRVAFLTAQKRTASSLESGFSFKDSVVAGSGQLYLGRAWGDFSRVVFSFTFMDSTVLPQGWSDWGDQKRDSLSLFIKVFQIFNIYLNCVYILLILLILISLFHNYIKCATEKCFTVNISAVDQEPT